MRKGAAMGAQAQYKGCKGCDNRTAEPNCHMTCRVYNNYVDELHKRKEMIKKEKNGRHNVFANTQAKGRHYT